MQRALFPPTAFTKMQSQATRISPTDGEGLEEQHGNDENHHEENSLSRWLLSILANVIGGTLLLSGMFLLPQVIAKILS